MSFNSFSKTDKTPKNALPGDKATAKPSVNAPAAQGDKKPDEATSAKKS